MQTWKRTLPHLAAGALLAAAGCHKYSVVELDPIHITIGGEARQEHTADTPQGSMPAQLGDKLLLERHFKPADPATHITTGSITYYALHGKWPSTLNDLSNTLSYYDAPHEGLDAISSITFKPQPDGSLEVEYTSSQTAQTPSILKLPAPRFAAP